MNKSHMIGCPSRGCCTKPLFRWQGGKQRLRTSLVGMFAGGYGRYIEPFIGAGSVCLTVRDGGFRGPVLLGGGKRAMSANNWGNAQKMWLGGKLKPWKQTVG